MFISSFLYSLLHHSTFRQKKEEPYRCKICTLPLGCCIPIAGLILFLVWKDTKPKTAKAAGIGALVYVGCAALMYLFALIGGITFTTFG